MTDGNRNLYVVACGGGYPAGDLPAFVRQVRSAGWDVRVVAAPSSLQFIDALDTGHGDG
ncbi:hypothetical protein [Frankia sp. BMG5.23]|uniref:hypothetical protein n=1 Tax=Frankia sp. BMG5.23 TaxID=683305 RepID=UPI00046172E3|nr:hypothetical protein [Frankia sp. BMG5.23]KDA41900.1 hypothetical protein BMG523Draft_03290 [Frankia sp. BMG5.23]